MKSSDAIAAVVLHITYRRIIADIINGCLIVALIAVTSSADDNAIASANSSIWRSLSTIAIAIFSTADVVAFALGVPSNARDIEPAHARKKFFGTSQALSSQSSSCPRKLVRLTKRQPADETISIRQPKSRVTMRVADVSDVSDAFSDFFSVLMVIECHVFSPPDNADNG